MRGTQHAEDDVYRLSTMNPGVVTDISSIDPADVI